MQTCIKPGVQPIGESYRRARAQGQGPVRATAVSIHPADPSEYWACADVHRRVFDAPSNGPPRPWDQLSQALARVDWCMTLQMNDSIQESGFGNVVVLVACTQTSDASTMPGGFADPHSFTARLATNMLAPRLRSGAGFTAEDMCMLGAAHLDSFGDKVPPRELDAQRDGAFGWYKREGIAYISNVAVLPSARRQGVAKALVEAAEKQASEWGCRSIGLHCNPKNKAAMGLYKNLGYRLTSIQEPVWVPWLNAGPRS